MLTKTYDIELNTMSQASPRTDIVINQGDVQSIIFNFRIFEQNGINEIDYGNVALARLFIAKADRNVVQITPSPAAGGQGFTVMLTEQAVACPGRATGELALYGHSDERIISLHFTFHVQPNISLGDTIVSLPEMDALNDAVALLAEMRRAWEDATLWRGDRGFGSIIIKEPQTAQQLHDSGVRVSDSVIVGDYIVVAGKALEPGDVLLRISDDVNDNAFSPAGSIRGRQGEPGTIEPRGYWSPSVTDYQRYDIVVYSDNGTRNSYMYNSRVPGLQMAPSDPDLQNPWMIWVYQGLRGDAATINLGDVTTLDPGEPAMAENVGDENDAVINLGIPQGRAATINIEEVITGEPGTNANVENIGTPGDAKLRLTIPRGDLGYAGDHANLVNLEYEKSGHTGFASQQELEERTSNAMPQAPQDGRVHGATGGIWHPLEGTELRAVITVSHPAQVTQVPGAYRIDNWDAFEVITVGHNGAQVSYFKGFSQSELYAMGRDSRLYKFTFDTTSHLVSIAESPLPAGTNPNLLHNWDFRNPVNQRGQAEYTTNGYTIDRFTAAIVNVEITADGVRLNRTASTGWSVLDQILEHNARVFIGKTMTMTIVTSDGIYVNTFTVNDTTVSGLAPIGNSGFSMQFRLDSGVGRFRITSTAINTPPSSVIIEAVKLELGPTSTLANDPPMDFGRELAICQRYYERSASNTALYMGTRFAASTDGVFVPYKVRKRIPPYVTLINQSGNRGNWQWWSTSGWETIESMTFGRANQDGFNPRMTIGGIAVNTPLLMIGGWEASADL